ncbi:MAG: methylmalonyl-CoA mutase family protein [Bryobacteraceae bacterium]
MPEPKADGLNLAADFPPVGTAEWEAVIKADLKGADYEKRLVWRTDEGLKIRPYYRQEDLAGLEAQAGIAPAQFPFTRGTAAGWEIAQSPEIPSNAVRGDRLHELGATAVQELAYALAEGVERLAAKVESGTSVDQAAPQILFVFGVGSNYFFTIAKLRAARLTWAQAVAAFGPAGDAACRMKIHAVTALTNKSICDPWTNLLRSTTEALSAALGGCDALSVRSFHYPERLADNIHLILKEEAHLDKVADAAGGSYYIEALTASMARAAWQLFQQIEAAGGYSQAVAAGIVDAGLKQSREAKQKAVAARRRTLVGVNNYPNLTERIAEPGPDDPAGRLAEAFEKIRLRTQRHATRTGRTPRVLLLTRGDLKMRMARAQFCQNFIGCAGFEIVESPEFEGAGADIIVLCASDGEYLALAQEVCPKVQAPVIVAGNPKEQITALEHAGVAGFLHIQSNAVETLAAWQDRLGMEA